MGRLWIAVVGLPLWVVAGAAVVAAVAYARDDTPKPEPDRVVGVLYECKFPGDEPPVMYGANCGNRGTAEKKLTVTVRGHDGNIRTFSTNWLPDLAVAIGDAWPPPAQ